MRRAGRVESAVRERRRDNFGDVRMPELPVLRTVAFFVERLRARTTNKDRTKEWNREFPKWRYSRSENFSRDVKDSERRLLGWWRED